MVGADRVHVEGGCDYLVQVHVADIGPPSSSLQAGQASAAWHCRLEGMGEFTEQGGFGGISNESGSVGQSFLVWLFGVAALVMFTHPCSKRLISYTPSLQQRCRRQQTCGEIRAVPKVKERAQL